MKRLAALLASVALVVASCGGGDDDADGPPTTSAESTAPVVTTAEPEDTAPAETSAETSAETTGEPADTTPETAAPTTPTTAAAAPFDETTLQELLLDAEPGDVIEIPAGTFSFDRSLSLDVDGVTIRGAGIDETILSFADQVVGAEGLLVSASDFTIEHLAIEDTIGDALKVNEGENITIRSVRTEWTGGHSTDNGAYGIYPVQTTNVLIEDSVAIGASDAGIYVGQSNNIIVRNNRAEFNVAGIEIENSVGADVYGNVVTNNTGGILIFNLPGLSQRGNGTRVFDNDVVANNTQNFAEPGTIVSVVPAGSGLLVMANDQVEIFGNRFADNRSANVIVTSSFSVDISGEDDPLFDGYPEGTFIHDNEYSGGGDAPDSILAALHSVVFPDGGVFPDIVWDGTVDQAKLIDGAQRPEDRLCVQEVDAQVLDADYDGGLAAPTVGVDAFDCTLEPLAPIELAGA
jgi:parallel beta-helix repeat protein